MTDATIESGIKTQFFSRLVLQEDLSGRVVLLPVGAELLALRRENAWAKARIAELQEQLEGLQHRFEDLSQPLNAVTTHGHPSPPRWQDIAAELPKHATKRYEQRKTDDVRYLVISHSAIPGTVQPSTIARFHVDHVQMAGHWLSLLPRRSGTALQDQRTDRRLTPRRPVGSSQHWHLCRRQLSTTQIPTPAQIESTAQLTAWLLHELGPAPGRHTRQERVCGRRLARTPVACRATSGSPC